MTQDLDRKLSAFHQRLAGLNEEISSGAPDAAQKIQEMGNIQNQVDECESKWLEVVEEKERSPGN